MRLDFPLFPEQASTIARDVDALYFFALAISAFFSLLIAVFIFVFFVRYRRSRAGQIGQDAHGPMILEVVWSAIPLGITMLLFGWGAWVYIHATQPPADAVEYFATGKQWMWKFQHPEGQREINTLHVPLGQRIKLTMTSEDVIHSFFVPAFRVKQDVLPGRYTTVWFEATKPGDYHLFCTEYCGAEHAQMIGTVTVMEPADYEAWLSGVEPGQPPVALGEELFAQYICNTCHFDEDAGRGPSLVGILGEEVTFADGTTLVRDEAYIRQSILDPRAHVVAGYPEIMPTFQGQINEVALLQLISYIKSLSGKSLSGKSLSGEPPSGEAPSDVAAADETRPASEATTGAAAEPDLPPADDDGDSVR